MAYRIIFLHVMHITMKISNILFPMPLSALNGHKSDFYGFKYLAIVDGFPVRVLPSARHADRQDRLVTETRRVSGLSWLV